MLGLERLERRAPEGPKDRRSHVVIKRQQGVFNLLAPFRKQATKGFLPIDWLATEVWSAAVAAT